MRSNNAGFQLRILLVGFIFAITTGLSVAQNTPVTTAENAPAVNDPDRDLREQVRALQAAVQELRSEASRSHREAEELRQELVATRAQITTQKPADPPAAPPDPPAAAQNSQNTALSTEERLARLDDEYQLLTGKIDEQYQAKVESWSKYRVRLSGIVLFNLFSDGGTVDNTDIPGVAYPNPAGSSGGSFGATLRQSQIGIEVTGPHFMGARASADLRFDFGGGFASVPNGVNYGLSWLRTGTVRLDWANTSVVAGQDALFFTPNTPTSFASLSIPAFNYAGNLWSWTPQIRIEHRFRLSDDSQFSIQGGLLDNLDGEPPANSNYRAPQAGESSRQPAYATRVAWMYTVFGQPLIVGAAGYYGRQNYGFGRNVDGWAGTTDWNLPLSSMFALSGKFYRGRAVGGIGGGIGTSILANGDPTMQATAIRGLNSAGGWAQFKFKPRSTLEFNAAFGEDNPYAGEVRYFAGLGTQPQGISLIRNQGSLFNVIYRPRSDLLFSAEYHYLKTFATGNEDYTANQLNLIMGVLF